MTDNVASNLTKPLQASPLGFRISLNLASVPVLAWLFLIVVLPNVLLIGVSFLKASGGVILLEPSLINYARIWNSAGFWVLLTRTLSFSFLGCVLATAIAFPLAFYVGRIARRYKTLLTVLVVLPLWISLLMRIFAWRIILGQSGVLNAALVSSGILDQPSDAFLYSPTAVVIVFAYISVPFIFISTMGAFEKIPRDLIEASQDSGATPIQTFLHLIWPLTRRNFAIGFSLAFLVTVGDFVTPAMIGGIDGTTLGVVVSTQFGFANNWPYGAAVAVALMISVALLLGAIITMLPTKGVMLSEEAEGKLPETNSSQRDTGRRLASIGVVASIFFLYAPLAIIVLFSFNSANLQIFPLQGLTLHWYQELLQDQSLLEAARRSVIVALCVVTMSVMLGTIFALIIHYARLKGARFFELAFALPIATPGVVLGIEMVLGTEIFSIPSGVARIVIGQMSFVMPVTMLLLLVRLRRLDPSLMEASLDLGANRWQSFIHVLFPMIRGTIVAGAFLGLTLSADDVMVTLFLSGGAPTLPIWVFNQLRFGFTPSVNAIFSLLLFACLLVVGFATWRTSARLVKAAA
ncbi:ABC transporter permease subunit [Rhizobium leguminosarum]|uniref:ABC transporter permease subunit n=1 Tax=Rhizobium leguminosarum TaxID=384 RepID=UPI00098F5285|nr:ABC transporter permease subunit [Rhizobium leguminosarum]ASS58001.1 ABC transporter permease [Rhizobium leguminosarum bv. viciae]MBB4333253.1 spermidine/putrescine transport system permease protein [Rhizobium leguminosarum]MBB4358930.1 spermidine/putrescine transport system permease protein [Rhizobium leguminosarum]MBB4390863.1 spermidine/putrescine transport system permease protein [Rhizobium leguminosarum]MBB4553411.1 spermidine/putrescine transport system permease protein [Rhizobium leg